MNNTGKLKPFVLTRADLRNITATVIGATVGCFDNSSFYMCEAATVDDVDDNEVLIKFSPRSRTKWVKTGYFGATVSVTDKFVRPRDPVATDDIFAGYPVFSEWMNSVTSDVFYCVDSTSGNAVWNKIQYVNL